MANGKPSGVWLLLAVLLLSQGLAAKAIPSAWTVRTDGLHTALTEGRSLEGANEDELSLVLNFDGLRKAFAVTSGQQRDGNGSTVGAVEMNFSLPGASEPVTCTLVQSNLFHPDLQAKYPELVSRTGGCSDGRSAHLNLDVGAEDSLAAYFTVPGSLDFIYVDSAAKASNRYTAYFKSKRKRGSNKFRCGVKSPAEEADARDVGRRLRGLAAATDSPTSAPTLQVCANAKTVSLPSGSLTANFASDNQNLDKVAAKTCGGSGAPKVGWSAKTFRFTAAAAGIYTFTTCKLNPNFDAVLTVRTDTCNGRLLGCNDETSGSLSCSTVSVTLVADQTVFIQVSAWGNSRGPSATWGGLTVSVEPYRSAIFRLAVVTNRQYSVWAGDSKSAVLNKIAATMARVNGIYMRELSVYMQLILGADSLFCTSADTSGCTLLPDKNPGAIIDNTQRFIERYRGIANSAYDIGHAFTTGAGGLAGLGVVCLSKSKAQGVTGRSNPTGDGYDVDYVAHEMGHQFGGDHTFRNCDNPDPNAVNYAAVEPGSGSTIMAYAGICTYNLQEHSDPYFHSYSIAQIRANLIKVYGSNVCGGTITTDANAVRPSPASPIPSSCVVPIGNFFQLKGYSSKLNANPNLVEYYQWDQVNAGLQKYTNMNLGVFRSWKPTTSRSRYFPNLYYLTRGIWNSNPVNRWERLPKTPANWVLRFMIRSDYITTSTSPSLDQSMLGDTGYVDVPVSFVKTIAPLKWTTATAQLLGGSVKAGSTQLFTWTVGGTASLSANVGIYVAKNLMTTTVESFDYETDLKELTWVLVGTVPNTGSASLVVPSSITPKPAEVNWMIRTAASDACFVFDYVARGTITA